MVLRCKHGLKNRRTETMGGDSQHTERQRQRNRNRHRESRERERERERDRNSDRDRDKYTLCESYRKDNETFQDCRAVLT